MGNLFALGFSRAFAVIKFESFKWQRFFFGSNAEILRHFCDIFLFFKKHYKCLVCFERIF